MKLSPNFMKLYVKVTTVKLVFDIFKNDNVMSFQSECKYHTKHESVQFIIRMAMLQYNCARKLFGQPQVPTF